jgi:hypothetical protein
MLDLLFMEWFSTFIVQDGQALTFPLLNFMNNRYSTPQVSRNLFEKGEL